MQTKQAYNECCLVVLIMLPIVVLITSVLSLYWPYILNRIDAISVPFFLQRDTKNRFARKIIICCSGTCNPNVPRYEDINWTCFFFLFKTFIGLLNCLRHCQFWLSIRSLECFFSSEPEFNAIVDDSCEQNGFYRSKMNCLL